jgi:hypothetical protein
MDMGISCLLTSFRFVEIGQRSTADAHARRIVLRGVNTATKGIADAAPADRRVHNQMMRRNRAAVNEMEFRM